jgi:protein transport protein SEC24
MSTDAVPAALQGSGATVLPETVPLSLSYMVEGGAYLIDTGRMLILWLGRALAPQWVADVFGLPLASIPSETSQLVLEPAKAHPMSQRVCALVAALRGCYGVHQEVFIVRQGTPLEAHVVPYFIEDRSHGQLSYADWVMALHKAVMSK